MADKKKINIETMEMKSRKKKTFIIMSILVLIVTAALWAIVSSLLKVQEEKIFKQKKEQSMIDQSLQVVQEPEFKENWAISIENKVEAQNKKIEEMQKKLQENQLKIFREIKDIIKESTIKNDQKFENMRLSVQKEITSFKKEVMSRLQKQDRRIENLEVLIDTIKSMGGTSGAQESEIVIGPDLLPKIGAPGEKEGEKVGTKEPLSVLEKNVTKTAESEKEVKEGKKKEEVAKAEKEKESEKKEEKIVEKVEKRKKLAVVDIDTSFNKRLVQEQGNIEKKEAEKEEELQKSMHVSIGLSKAYLVTGVYAPVFQEGQEEPLPVLLEAEGDVIMPNMVRGNLGKCLLIGSAKGNMNSQTAKIRLEKINCLLDDGKYRIEGNIRGWVVDKSGIPGIHGELLHKNGAWLARTFVAGFLETFAEAITTSNVEAINFGTTNTYGGVNTDQVSTKQAIGNNLAVAGGSGLATVFKKLGDYYLKMAEQIFPVIEVKGGQVVNIFLMGGEDLTVVENTPVDISKMESMLVEYEAKKADKKAMKSEESAFKKIASEGDDGSFGDGGGEVLLDENGNPVEPAEKDVKPLSDQEINQIVIP